MWYYFSIMRSPLLITLLLSTLVVLAVTHISAITFFLYWKYWWLDIITHTLGGISVALGVMVLQSFIIRVPKRYFTMFPIILVVIFVGLLWEWYEVAFGISLVADPDFISDTIIDIVMDILGGALGYFVGNRLRIL